MSKSETTNPKIIVTLPVMDELGYIEKCIDCIRQQTYRNFYLIVCVNQPNHWWSEPAKKHVCDNNLKTITYLENISDLPIEVIDRSSPGKGFLSGEKGVGHARNLLFERALNISNDNDLVMCLDADTVFEPAYFQSVVDVLKPDALAHVNPYYHNLSGKEEADRAVLRYEIYMRLYVLNLWRIESPYAFTPLGSAITMFAKSLNAVGKVAPKPAGEDFYLLQKLRKHGRIVQYNDHFVYPSPRISKRVPFGTGPAVADGIKHKWERYPIYPVEPFDMINETYKLFPVLFEKDVPTPMDEFFEKVFGTRKIFKQLRSNCTTVENFIKACHIKIDGLRIMQFVKYYHKLNYLPDEENLAGNLLLFMNNEEKVKTKYFFSPFKFENISIPLLQNLRNILTSKEQNFRKKDFYEPQMSR